MADAKNETPKQNENLSTETDQLSKVENQSNPQKLTLNIKNNSDMKTIVLLMVLYLILGNIKFSLFIKINNLNK